MGERVEIDVTDIARKRLTPSQVTGDVIRRRQVSTVLAFGTALRALVSNSQCRIADQMEADYLVDFGN